MPKTVAEKKTYRFEQMAKLVNDRVDDPAESGVERYVGLEHLDADSLRIRRWGEITDVESTKLRFQPGDIIFGKRRVYQRKLAVADFEGICSAHAMVLRAKPDVVLPEFLPFFMQSDHFMERALEISVGSLSPTINWKTLAAEEFALPPIEEQQRLVAALTAIWDCEERLNDALARAISLEESVLVSSLFEDPNSKAGTNSEHMLDRVRPGFVLERISDVADVAYGISAAVSNNTNPAIGWPILTGANITLEGNIDLFKIVYHPAPKKDDFVLRRGDVLLNWRSGSAEHVGKAALFDLNGDWTFASFILRVRSSEQLNNRYLWRLLNFMRKKRLFGKSMSQQINFKMNAAYFRNVHIPCPARERQDSLVCELQLAWNAIEALRSRRNRLHELRNMVMREGSCT